MSRIEEIKRRLKPGTPVPSSDVLYLISLLEIAEKELQYVLERDGYMAVKEALDKIRE